MQRILSVFVIAARFVLCLFVLFLATVPAHATRDNDTAIASRSAEMNGVKLHYLTAGHGTPLILLHGYAETSLMWKPLIPALAERFTVIAPDLPRNRRLGYSPRWSGHEECGHPHS